MVKGRKGTIAKGDAFQCRIHFSSCNLRRKNEDNMQSKTGKARQWMNDAAYFFYV